MAKFSNALAAPAFAAAAAMPKKAVKATPRVGPKPVKAAGGMPDVPAPGQTVTNGTWNPNNVQPTGQNQNLRSSLGLGVNKPANMPSTGGNATRAAGGSACVSGMDRAMSDHADKMHPVKRR